MTAGPRDSPTHPTHIAPNPILKKASLGEGKCSFVQSGPYPASLPDLLLTTSVEYHHASNHKHRVPVEHVDTAIPGKATTPVLHPVDSEEDAHGAQGPQQQAGQVEPSRCHSDHALLKKEKSQVSTGSGAPSSLAKGRNTDFALDLWDGIFLLQFPCISLGTTPPTPEASMSGWA